MAWIKDHLQKISNLREMKKKIQKHHLGDYFSSLYIILVAESSTPHTRVRRYLSCEDLLSGKESPIHYTFCFSLELFHTLQHDSSFPSVSVAEQQEHHLSAAKQSTKPTENLQV